MKPHEIEFITRLSSVLDLAGRKHNEYIVTLEEGVWPSAFNLVQYVDKGDPSSPYFKPRNGGGEVIETEDPKVKIVKVFKEGY
jgi:hypothetical protein